MTWTPGDLRIRQWLARVVSGPASSSFSRMNEFSPVSSILLGSNRVDHRRAPLLDSVTSYRSDLEPRSTTSTRAASATATTYRNVVLEMTAAIERDPEDRRAYMMRGSHYLDGGNFEEAVRDLTTAIELEPFDAMAFNNRGVAYRRLQRPEEAIADFDRASSFPPGTGKPSTTAGWRGPMPTITRPPSPISPGRSRSTGLLVRIQPPRYGQVGFGRQGGGGPGLRARRRADRSPRLLTVAEDSAGRCPVPSRHRAGASKASRPAAAVAV